MAIGFVILIALALGLSIFAVTVKKGANVVVLDGALVESGLIGGLFQIGAASLGYAGGRLLLSREVSQLHSLFWIHLLAGFLLALIGIRMLLQGLKKETILEHRMQKIDMKADTVSFLRLCTNALLAGCAFGLMKVNLWILLFLTFLAAIVGIVAGYFGGRSFGGESSNKAWAIGGGILCIVGICLQLIG